MSPNGQEVHRRPLPPAGLAVDLAPNARFDWHTHAHHQLALAARGVLTMPVGETAWVLPRPG